MKPSYPYKDSDLEFLGLDRSEYENSKEHISQAIGKLSLTTIIAYYFRLTLSMILFLPMVPVTIVSRFLFSLIFIIPVLGALFRIMIGVAWSLIFVYPIWLLSFMWIKVPLLRLLIMPFGVIFSSLGNLYLQLTPDIGAETSKSENICMTYQWVFASTGFNLTLRQGCTWRLIDAVVLEKLTEFWNN